MITFGICLIYYSIALFLYQVYGWLNDGIWTPFAVRRAWVEFFGAPGPVAAPFDAVIEWFFAWPLSLALLSAGCCILCAVFGIKRVMVWRRDRLRRDWILKQCDVAGYQPWTVPKVMQELDDRMQAEKLARREEAG